MLTQKASSETKWFMIFTYFLLHVVFNQNNPLALVVQICNAMYWPCCVALSYTASGLYCMYSTGSFFMAPYTWLTSYSDSGCYWAIEYGFNASALVFYPRVVKSLINKSVSFSMWWFPFALHEEYVQGLKEIIWLAIATCWCMYIIELVAYGTEDDNFTDESIPYDCLYATVAVGIITFVVTDYHTRRVFQSAFQRSGTKPSNRNTTTKEKHELTPMDCPKRRIRTCHLELTGLWTKDTFEMYFENMKQLVNDVLQSERNGDGGRLLTDVRTKFNRYEISLVEWGDSKGTDNPTENCNYKCKLTFSAPESEENSIHTVTRTIQSVIGPAAEELLKLRHVEARPVDKNEVLTSMCVAAILDWLAEKPSS